MRYNPQNIPTLLTKKPLESNYKLSWARYSIMLIDKFTIAVLAHINLVHAFFFLWFKKEHEPRTSCGICIYFELKEMANFAKSDFLCTKAALARTFAKSSTCIVHESTLYFLIFSCCILHRILAQVGCCKDKWLNSVTS